MPNKELDTKVMLDRILKILEIFRYVNQTISVQVATTFLLVAVHPGKSLTELSRISGFPLSTVSRNLLDLGIRNRKKEPGYGLVVTTTDEFELRRKNVNLTPLGKKLIDRIMGAIKT